MTNAIPFHNLFGIVDCLHMLHSLNEIPQTPHAQPEGFDAGLAIALSAENAAQHGDFTDEFACGGRVLGMTFLARM